MIKPTTWNPYFIHDSEFRGSVRPLGIQLCPEVTACFRDAQYLIALINGHWDTNTRLCGVVFQDSMHSIHSRLLSVDDSTLDITSQCARWGVLAFLATTIHIPRGDLPYAHLLDRLRTLCQNVELTTPELRRFVMWLLVVGTMLVFESDEPWLQDRWRAAITPELSWASAQKQLKNIMWIDCVQDEAGETAFLGLMTSETGG